jgi:hypothetical protein
MCIIFYQNKQILYKGRVAVFREYQPEKSVRNGHWVMANGIHITSHLVVEKDGARCFEHTL